MVFLLLLVLQQSANIVLMLTAAAIGLLCYFLAEAKHRRAFLEAKQSLEVKMVIEEQSAEQVRLISYTKGKESEEKTPPTQFILDK